MFGASQVYDSRVEPGKYSFVVPVYNEEDALRPFAARLEAVLDGLDGPAEVLFVDDGSTDRSFEILGELHAADERHKTIRLARNFGHQIAITAGLDHARGDAVVVLDADLQDPPELVHDLVKHWQQGYDVVYGIRTSRGGDRRTKRVTAGAFYRLLRLVARIDIPPNVGDFRLLDRRAVDALRLLRERTRYVRGLASWIGFRQIGVPYERAGRVAGSSSYTYDRSLRLGVDALISFSAAPLRTALAAGVVVSVVSFGIGVFALVAKIAGAAVVPGWASILAAFSFVGGVQLVLLALIGLYVAAIYDEVKRRPLYLVREAHGLVAPGDPVTTEPAEEALLP